ncbi:hypothetical protein CONPUDRAFT_91761 [Coniophora puteana RWD-64-598 SS2]|uniref:Uncharacterized protein n=1 Tax=Coniophora puteana (strain RWD-64-598) TaxID=741705 RepID=A0A5M3MG95_CONPW|nr:uncharacterized protein CONPUDRAFT_91761 [Coniophora puteana RWD-64-598 SS2]EIW78269.1 hypothetical protein CONPUDRAFT_91761 [Coniophora puteana RWD-64-598 SS2]
MTLAVHWGGIRGYSNTSESTETATPYAPRGAMALCAAACERACALAAEGKLGKLEDIIVDIADYKASGAAGSTLTRAKTLLKNSQQRQEVNERTGKASTHLSNFSEQNWKRATDGYWALLNKPGKATDEFVAARFNEALKHCPKSRRSDEADEVGAAVDVEMADADVDERANLPWDDCNVPFITLFYLFRT